jgi:hypothetical protein
VPSILQRKGVVELEEDEISESSSESYKLQLQVMKDKLKKKRKAEKLTATVIDSGNNKGVEDEEDEVEDIESEPESKSNDSDDSIADDEYTKVVQNKKAINDKVKRKGGSEKRTVTSPYKKARVTLNNVAGSKTKSTTESLMARFTKIATKNKGFGRKNAWYTLKFNTLKECSAARYYVVQMELSNDDDGEQINIWLKASFIQDVLKCLAQDDPCSVSLFNGFQEVIINGALAELREKPYGENVFRANKKDGITYKEYINYYLIPKEMGSHKETVEQFKNTMVELLQSDEFFVMMTVYQNERNNRGGQPGNILRDATSDIWTQLKAENNNRLNYIESLNAKFTDDEINIILSHLFEENSIEAKYQKFGWKDKTSNPWKKSKKN